METVKYITNTKGEKTGLFIDLLNPQTDSVFKDLNQGQVEILKLFVGGFSDEYLGDLKKNISKFLAEKLLNNGDAIWEERKYTKKTFETFVEND